MYLYLKFNNQYFAYWWPDEPGHLLHDACSAGLKPNAPITAQYSLRPFIRLNLFFITAAAPAGLPYVAV